MTDDTADLVGLWRKRSTEWELLYQRQAHDDGLTISALRAERDALNGTLNEVREDRDALRMEAEKFEEWMAKSRAERDALAELLRRACEALEDANAKLRISDYPSDWGVAERCDAALIAIYAKIKP